MGREGQRRGAFGTITSVITLVIALMKLPADIGQIATSWGEARVEVPAELVRLLLIAVMGVVSAWTLGPSLAAGARWAWQHWRRHQKNKREAVERQRADENQLERMVEFIVAMLDDHDYGKAFHLLMISSSEIPIRIGEPLAEMGIAEKISPVTRGFCAVYRLTGRGRQALEAMDQALRDSADAQD